MKEREPEFSEEEKDQIGKMAIALAQTGEDAIFDLVRMRIQFQYVAYISEKKGIALKVQIGEEEEVSLTSEEAKHESDVMGEVIRQARVILQMEGKDDLSILDKHYRDAGLGSIFDPESEASKRLTWLRD